MEKVDFATLEGNARTLLSLHNELYESAKRRDHTFDETHARWIKALDAYVEMTREATARKRAPECATMFETFESFMDDFGDQYLSGFFYSLKRLLQFHIKNNQIPDQSKKISTD